MQNILKLKEEILSYKLIQIESNGNLREVGTLLFGVNLLESGFRIWVEKEISIIDNHCKEKFETVYKTPLDIVSMASTGNVNGCDYTFNANISNNTIKLFAQIGSNQQKHAVNIPKCFLENNTFSYILPFLLKEKKEINLPVFIPVTATFVETKITMFPHLEKVELPIGSFNCQRVKIESLGSIKVSQFLIYCNLTGRLIKGSIENQVFELINIDSN